MPAGKVNRGALCGPRVQRVQKERLTGLRPFGQRVVFSPLRRQKGIAPYNPCASLRRDCHEVAQGCTTRRVEVLLYSVGTAPSKPPHYQEYSRPTDWYLPAITHLLHVPRSFTAFRMTGGRRGSPTAIPIFDPSRFAAACHTPTASPSIFPTLSWKTKSQALSFPVSSWLIMTSASPEK